MLFPRRDGIGQDQEMVRLRRRPLVLSLMLVAGIVVLLTFSFLFLRERRGSLLVDCDQEGALVVLNGSTTPTPAGKIIRNLLPDTYDISVSKAGFLPQPPSQLIRLKSGKTTKVSFSLLPAPTAPPAPVEDFSAVPLAGEPDSLVPNKSASRIAPHKPVWALRDTASSGTLSPAPPIEKAKAKASQILPGSLHVITDPAKGKIFVDDAFQGQGEARLGGLSLGETVVHFGELEGFKTPEPVKVFLSSDQPAAEAQGIYLPLIYIAAYLDGSGRAVCQRTKLNLGYILENEHPIYDAVAGPGVKLLEETGAFAWELGYAFSNRNPPGRDFIELIFNLPARWDGVKPLELRLYGFGSQKRYPFSAGATSNLDIYVNDKPAQRGWRAGQQNASNGSEAFASLAINGLLQVGENCIRIQSSGDNHCYYYLWKIVLL